MCLWERRRIKWRCTSTNMRTLGKHFSAINAIPNIYKFYEDYRYQRAEKRSASSFAKKWMYRIVLTVYIHIQ